MKCVGICLGGQCIIYWEVCSRRATLKWRCYDVKTVKKTSTSNVTLTCRIGWNVISRKVSNRKVKKSTKLLNNTKYRWENLLQLALKMIWRFWKMQCILVDRPTLGFERILNKLRILEYLLCWNRNGRAIDHQNTSKTSISLKLLFILLRQIKFSE